MNNMNNNTNMITLHGLLCRDPECKYREAMPSPPMTPEETCRDMIEWVASKFPESSLVSRPTSPWIGRCSSRMAFAAFRAIVTPYFDDKYGEGVAREFPIGAPTVSDLYAEYSIHIGERPRTGSNTRLWRYCRMKHPELMPETPRNKALKGLEASSGIAGLASLV